MICFFEVIINSKDRPKTIGDFFLPLFPFLIPLSHAMIKMLHGDSNLG